MSRAFEFSFEHQGRTFRGLPFTADHIPDVMDLESACFPDPWSENLFLQESKPEDHRWNLVLLDGEDLAAYAISWVVSGEIHLLNFAVRPDLQGQGLGRAFFRWLKEESRRAGDSVFLLEVRASNERARKLYESEGLRGVMKREGYYPDSGEDALVMMCFLQDEQEEAP